MLILSRKCGQVLHIGDDIHITITEVSGDKVKIGIEAPRDVNIARDELVRTVNENQSAAKKINAQDLKSLALELTKHKPNEIK